jgi:nucleoside-diphosphate-sugar epimerase
MRKKVILVTGAAGEIGLALIQSLAQDSQISVHSLDLQALPPSMSGATTHIQGDILDRSLLSRLVSEYEIDTIYHLAALLSTRSEFTPEAAHRVNVEGTLVLLQLAAEQSEWRGQPVKLIFPSSIAAYGMPDLETKSAYHRVREWEWNYPRTMYGCNKLYCEQLGIYFSQHYRQLAADRPVMLDFRCVRFPGLISAMTVPSGGTSDYGPEMLHAAAQGKPYACFVRADTKISFMAMPDAIRSLLMLMDAPRGKLTQAVYNIAAFAITAEEFRQRAVRAFPNAKVTFEPNPRRQGIVDSWPEDVDDSRARADWGWKPDYDADKFFDEYFLPEIRKRYGK